MGAHSCTATTCRSGAATTRLDCWPSEAAVVVTCARCGHRLGATTWLRHSRDCNRAIDGFCHCTSVVHETCMRPSVSSRVTPLAARLRAAHDRQLVVAVEVS